MMVGELTYEENFVDEGILSQTIFLIMVIILTTLLNNLLIGLTTSNISDLMKKAKTETTFFMLRDLLDEYSRRNPRIVLQPNRKITLHRKIVTVKNTLGEIKKSHRYLGKGLRK